MVDLVGRVVVVAESGNTRQFTLEEAAIGGKGILWVYDVDSHPSGYAFLTPAQLRELGGAMVALADGLDAR